MAESVALSAVPPGIDPGLTRFLQAVKNALEVRTNQRGTGLKASPTFQDLLDAGLISLKDGITIGGQFVSAEQLIGQIQINVPDWVTSATAPPAPAGLVVSANTSNTVLTWTASTFSNYSLTEIWRAATNNLSVATQVSSVSGNTFVDQLPPTGVVWYYWIRDMSLNGLESPFNAVSGVPTVAGPSVSGSATYVVDGEFIDLLWATPTSALTIQYYIIRYGSDYATGTPVSITNANNVKVRVDWSGARTFWVAAVDVNGNVGTPTGIYVSLSAPGAPTVTQQAIDNNVLLFWTAAVAPLPVTTYEIRKGSTWAGAAVVGTKSGHFTNVFETVAGDYTYWVAAIDSSGAYGTPGSTTATVAQPPDYVLRVNQDSTFSGTKSSLVASGTGLLGPVNLTETFAEHFTSRGWAGPSDQITAGYPYFIQPTASSGYYEEIIDYGTTLSSTKITITAGITSIVGTITQDCQISLSPDGTTYTDYPSTWQMLGTAFRYIKVRLTINSSAGSFGTLDSLNIRLDAKLKTINGMVNCSSADTGGTTVYLTDTRLVGGTKMFSDVDSIVVTPQGTSAVIAVYDFTDAPDPLSFKILLFNPTTGTRVSGWASYVIRGY